MVANELLSLVQLDQAIAEADVPGVDRGKLISDIAYYPDMSSLADLDPFSEPYLANVKRIYEAMREGVYDVNDEANTLEYSLTEPSPYSSRHPNLIGHHIGSIVTVVRDIGKSPPARVLDLGFGAGDTSLMLARCGFDVDAVDVNQRFVENLKYWSKRFHVEDRINAVALPFDQISSLGGPYDAILFFESFHHSLNHAALIAELTTKLHDDGVVIFAGEPIYDHFPIPWGLRHAEGLATYCIRKFGWMELGFQTSYFLELLERHGLFATYRSYSDYPVANHYRAARISTGIPILDLCIRDPYAGGWHKANGDMRWTKGKAGLPLALFPRSAPITIQLQNHAPTAMVVTLRADTDVLCRHSIDAGELAVVDVRPSPTAEALWIDAPEWSPRSIGLRLDDRTLGIAVRAIGVGR